MSSCWGEDDDDRWCHGIGLHDFNAANVKWKEWFYFVENFTATRELKFTRIIVNGKYYGDSTKTILYRNGKKKLEHNDFEEIGNVGMMVMNNKDDYTTNFIAYASMRPDQQESWSLLAFAIDEHKAPFTMAAYNELATQFINFTGAKYGYYYYRHLRSSSDCYPMGDASCPVDNDDARISNNWSRCSWSKIYQTGQLRDIYKLNFLSQEHLTWPIFNTTLGEWISSSPSHGELHELIPGERWSWYVADELIEPVRAALIPTKILLAYIDRDEFLQMCKEYDIANNIVRRPKMFTVVKNGRIKLVPNVQG